LRRRQCSDPGAQALVGVVADRVVIGHAFHAKDLERSAVAARDGIGHRLELFLVDLDHVDRQAADRVHLLVAHLALEMLGLLVLHQHVLVLELAVAVPAPRPLSLLLALLLVLALAVCGALAATDYSKYNVRKGKEFRDENAKKPGVVVLPSGLQYEVIQSGTGTGRSPKSTDQVKVHYRGTLINGKEFDSSYSRGQPATFGVNGVIKGWTEALQLMKEGDIWQLVIPPELAYGERGTGRDIGPNATLVFKVELIKVL